MAKEKFEVQWAESDDKEFEEQFEQEVSEEENKEFQKMLEGESVQSMELEPLAVGSKVQATISYMGEKSEDILLDLGRKTSAVIAKQELLDENGLMKFSRGDKVEGYIASIKDGEVIVSKSLSASIARSNALEDAYVGKIPVKGKVIKAQKGGFEVTVLGKTGFCPISQIDVMYVDKPEDYVGREFDFRILKLAKRDLLVSRAVVLEAQAEETLKQLKDGLDQDLVLEGEVRELKDFGAMVDLGGLMGMVHISEMSFGRPQHPSDLLELGQKIKVKLLSIDENGKHTRVALSMKSLQQDPWESIEQDFEVGASYTGRVTRLKEFGAFIELKPGIEGLIHLSEMSWLKRVYHPKELLKLGDKVSVRLLDINAADRKMSLSIKSIEEDPWHDFETKFPIGANRSAPVEHLKSFGAIVKLGEGVTGLVPQLALRKMFGHSFKKKSSPPNVLEVKILKVEKEARKILLGLQGQDDSNAEEDAFKEYVHSQAQPKAGAEKKSGSFGDLLAASFNKKSKK